MHAGAQGGRAVIVVDGNCFLQDDRATVGLAGFQQLHGAPGQLHAVGQSILDRVHPTGEGGQQ